MLSSLLPLLAVFASCGSGALIRVRDATSPSNRTMGVIAPPNDVTIPFNSSYEVGFGNLDNSSGLRGVAWNITMGVYFPNGTLASSTVSLQPCLPDAVSQSRQAVDSTADVSGKYHIVWNITYAIPEDNNILCDPSPLSYQTYLVNSTFTVGPRDAGTSGSSVPAITSTATFSSPETATSTGSSTASSQPTGNVPGKKSKGFKRNAVENVFLVVGLSAALASYAL
ncbi:hypothetical protein C8J56DRAFT_1168312 [Mycena floridula]|nr:hypothetical protein C8J56DRAFT_1168312 [Mycena floridula]